MLLFQLFFNCFAGRRCDNFIILRDCFYLLPCIFDVNEKIVNPNTECLSSPLSICILALVVNSSVFFHDNVMHGLPVDFSTNFDRIAQIVLAIHEVEIAIYLIDGLFSGV